MTVNKKVVFAVFFVACLMAVSMGAIATSSTEGSSTHYTDIDEPLLFMKGTTEMIAENSKEINEAVGSEVCHFDTSESKLVFTQSCALRHVGEGDYFMLFTNCGIIVEKDVVVTIAGGQNYEPTGESDEYYGLIYASGVFSIEGDGELNVILNDPGVISVAIDYVILAESSFTISNVTLNMAAPGHACIGFAEYTLIKNPTIDLKGSDVTLEGKYAIVCDHTSEKVVSIHSSEADFKFIGSESAFLGKLITIQADKKIYASMSSRGTDIQDFDQSKAMQYQYITTDETKASSLVLPLAIVFGIACIILIYYVFLYNPRPVWEQEKINAEKAKKKAELAAKRAEEKKIADAKRAEMEKKKAEERRIAEEKKAKERAELEKKRAEEAKAKEEARKVAEAKRAEERRIAEEKKAADRKAAEEKKAKEAEERKAAEAKKAAEKKAAAEAKAKEAEAKKAIEAKKAKEAKQKEEAKKAEKAKKAAKKK